MKHSHMTLRLAGAVNTVLEPREDLLCNQLAELLHRCFVLLNLADSMWMLVRLQG